MPYRPLFVETDDMKATYQLTTDEIQEAIVQWLESEKSLMSIGDYSDKLIWTLHYPGSHLPMVDLEISVTESDV